MKAVVRLVTAIAAVTGLYLAFFYGLHARVPDILTRIITYLSYFTILTNAIIALAMAVPAVAPGSRAGRFLEHPPVRAAIAGYIIVVAAVYHVMLAPVWTPEGLNLAAQIILHTIVPVAFVLDWLVFTRRGKTSWRTALYALALPLLYGAWILGYGAWTGFYPYPFLDVADLGHVRVIANMTVLTLLFICVELAVVAIDKLLAPRRRDSARARART